MRIWPTQWLYSTTNNMCYPFLPRMVLIQVLMEVLIGLGPKRNLLQSAARAPMLYIMRHAMRNKYAISSLRRATGFEDSIDHLRSGSSMTEKL